MKSLFKNAFMYSGSTILSASLPFLLLPVLTRVLSPEEYGLASMFSIILSIASAITGLSVHGAVAVEFFKRGKQELAQFVGACTTILLLSTSGLLLIALLFRGPIEAHTQLPLNWIVLAILSSGAMFLVNVKMTLWQVKQNTSRYASLQVSQALTHVSLSLVFVLTFGWGWKGRSFGHALAILLTALAALLLLYKDQELSFGFRKEDLFHALAFGLPLIPHNVGALLMATADRFMISHMLGTAAMGMYMVGFQVSMILSLLTDSFNRAYAPWLMQALHTHDEKRNRIIVGFSYAYFVGVTIIALLVGLCFPLVARHLVGEKFAGADQVVIYVLVGFAFGGMYYMVTNYLFYARKTGYLAFVTLVSGLVNVLLNYFLILSHGIVGAALAFMLSQGITFLGTWYFAAKVHKMPWAKPDFSFLSIFRWSDSTS